MFPVTLQSWKESEDVVTVWPPCYGFLKAGYYQGGDYDEDDEDDDPDYYNTYDSNYGWNIRIKVWSKNMMVRQGTAEENVLENMLPMSEIKYIWNSGTHLPAHGVRRYGDTEYIATQYFREGLENEDPRPPSHVETWAEENNRPDITDRVVMETFAAFMDKDSDSCLVWHEVGFMGVCTEGCPADRALFYLMLNRTFYTDDEKSAVYEMLNKMYKKGWSPLASLAFSRLINSSVDVFGNERVALTGNDYDSCIFQASLYTVGVGSTMIEPRQTKWRQCEYTEGEGHLRDEDFSSLIYRSEGVRDCRVNNSMFLPILLPQYCHLSEETRPIITEKSLLVEFIREVTESETSFAKIVFGYNWNNETASARSYNMYNIISSMSNGLTGSNYTVRPSEEWENILEKLFFNK